MATLRDIKRRINGVTSTQQITKAMKMVAAAKLRRAQDNIINAKPYSKKISEIVNNLINIEKDISDALLEERELEKIAIIVVTSDSGLCGAFNMNVIRYAEEKIQEEYKQQLNGNNLSLYCIGKKGIDYFSRRDYNIVEKKSHILNKLTFEDVTEMVNDLTEKFVNKEIDKVLVVYNEFKSVIQQNLNFRQILPIVPVVDTTEKQEEEKIQNVEYIYEPDKKNIIKFLLPKYLNSTVWTLLLDSYAAELGARMTAMDLATENAGELIASLKIQYNKERQASITTEILEIVSGAEALRNK